MAVGFYTLKTVSIVINFKKIIIEQAVDKIKKLGFVNVSPENIMKDDVYRHFFERILKEEEWKNAERYAALEQLLKEIGGVKSK